MSNSIDQRIVEMAFDNQQFEKGIQTSVKSLDNLKQGLDMEESAKSFDKFGSSIKAFSLDKLAECAETIGSRFTTMGIIGVTALQNIVNKAVDAGLAIVKSLSIDQITSGFSKYEQEISSVQTIMNATGKTMGETQKYLDQLGWYADETSYSYTDMVGALSKFTSAGVAPEKAIPAIEGIANWAAVSGVNATDASRAFYNLAQAMGTGSVKLQDWKSIELLNMATPEFKQMAIEAAVAAGTVKDLGDGYYVAMEQATAASKLKRDKDRKAYLEAQRFTTDTMSQSLASGWFTSDVLTGVLGDYGAYSEEVFKLVTEKGITAAEAMEYLGVTTMTVSEKAFKAAQEAKTFTDAINATKDAVSSGWRNTFRLLIGNYEEAKDLWSDFAEWLYNTFAESANQRNELLEAWREKGGRDDLVTSFQNILEATTNVSSIVKEAIDTIFPPTTADRLKTITEAIQLFTERVKVFTEDSEKMSRIRRIVEGIASVFSILKTIIFRVWEGFKQLAGLAFPNGSEFLETFAKIGDFLVELKEKLDGAKAVNIGEKLKAIFTPIQKAEDDLSKNAPNDSVIGRISSFLSGIIDAVKNFITNASGLELGAVFAALFGVVILRKIGRLIGSFTNIGNALSDGISGVGKAITTAIGEFGKGDMSESILNLTSAIAMIATALATMSQIEPDRLVGALVATGIIMAAIVGLAFALSKVKLKRVVNVTAVSLALVPMGFALMLFAKTVQTLGKMDENALVRGIIGLGFVMLGVITFLAIAQKVKFSLFKGAALILLAVSMNLFAKAIAGVGNLDMDTILRGLTGLGGVMLELAVFLALTKKVKMGVFQGIAMILLAKSVSEFGNALGAVGALDDAAIKRGLIGLGGVLLELAIFLILTKKMSSELAGFAIISSLGAAVKEIAAALTVLGTLNEEQIKNGIVGLGGVLLELAIFLALTRKAKLGVFQGVAIILLAIAMKQFAEAIAFIGALPTDAIIKGIAGLGGVLLELAIFLALTKKAKIGIFKGAGLVLLAIAMQKFAEAIGFMGSLDTATIVKGIVGLGVVMIELAAFLAVTNKVKIGIFKGAGLILLAVAMKLFADAIAAMGGLDASTITKGIVGLGFVMTELIIFLALAKKVNFGVFQGVAMILLAASLNEFAKAIGQIGKLKPSQIIKGIVGLGGVLSVLLVFMKALSKFKISGIGKALLVLGVMAVAMVAFALVLTNIKDIDPSVMLGFTGSLGIALLSMAATFALLSAIPVTAILLGIAKLALIFAAVVGVMALFGALEEWLNLSSVIEKFGDLLESIGAAFGRLISGFLTGAVSGLAGVGTELSAFMTNAQTFIDGAKKIDSTVVAGVGNLVSVITAIAGANVIDAIASWLTGRSSMETFADDVTKLGGGIAAFAKSVSGITAADKSTMDNAVNAAEGLVALNNALNPEGGVVDWFEGSHSEALKKFAENIPTLATALNDYASGISLYGDEKVTVNVENAKAAAEGLIALNNSLPAEGGIINDWFTGSHAEALKAFASTIPMLATALNEYAMGISAYESKKVNVNVENALAAAQGLISLNASLPAEGGIQEWFTGSHAEALKTFADTLPTLAEALNAYADGIDAYGGKNVSSKIGNINTALTGLVTLNDGLPGEGGIKSWWTGDYAAALRVFAETLPDLAAGLNAYAEGIEAYSGKDVSQKLTNVNAALTGLISLNTSLPGEGGIKSWWNGNYAAALKTFAETIPDLADGLNQYSEGVNKYSGADVSEKIENVNAATVGLVALNNSLQGTGGIKSWWDGSQSEALKVFAETLPDLADGLNQYSEGVNKYSGVDVSEKIKNVNSATTGLVSLNNSLQGTGGVRSWWDGSQSEALKAFAGTLPDLAIALNQYLDEIGKFKGGVSSEQIKLVNEAATGLVTLNNALSPTGGVVSWFSGDTDLQTFADKIPAIGTALATFATNIAGVDLGKSTDATTVLNNINAFATDVVANKNNWTKLKNISDNMATFGTNFKTFTNGIVDASSGITNIEFVKTAVAGFQELSGLYADQDGGKYVNGGVVVGWRGLGTIAEAMSAFGATLTNFSMGDGIVTFANNYETIKNGIADFQELSGLYTGQGVNLYTDGKYSLGKVMDSFVDFGTKLNSLTLSVTDVDKIKAVSEVMAVLTGMAADATLIDPTKIGNIEAVLTEFGALDLTTLTNLFGESGTEAGESFADNVVLAIQNGSESVRIAVVKLSGDGSKAADETVKTWKTSGNNLAIGLANGISAMAGRVRNAATNAAAGAIRSIQVVWSVHSPSRVASELGMNFDLGLSGGLDDYAKVVISSAENVSKEALNSARSILTGFSAIDEMDSMPVIRPVVDMSEVVSSVNTINGLFDANRTVNTGMFTNRTFNRNAGALRTADGKMESVTSNRDVVEAIGKLTERFNHLSEAVGNMQLVLDTGTLVGGIDTKMDKQLGVIAARKGRGN